MTPETSPARPRPSILMSFLVMLNVGPAAYVMGLLLQRMAELAEIIDSPRALMIVALAAAVPLVGSVLALNAYSLRSVRGLLIALPASWFTFWALPLTLLLLRPLVPAP